MYYDRFQPNFAVQEENHVLISFKSIGSLATATNHTHSLPEKSIQQSAMSIFPLKETSNSDYTTISRSESMATIGTASLVFLPTQATRIKEIVIS
jgi:hypothetical protein